MRYFLITERNLNIKGNRYYGAFVFLVCTLLWQLFDVNEIEDFVFRLIKVTEYQPIDNSIVVGVFVSLCALWFADRSSTKDIIFRHKDSDRYIFERSSNNKYNFCA